VGGGWRYVVVALLAASAGVAATLLLA